MQPNRTSRRKIIVLNGSEVEQGSDNPQDARTGLDNPRAGKSYKARVRQPWADTLRASRQGSDNPQGAKTVWVRQPASYRTWDNSRSARTGTPHASKQGSDNPRVAGTGSENSGSDNPRAARQETRSAVQGSDNGRHPARVQARVRQPTSWQATDQQIERVRTSTGTGRSGCRRIHDSVGSRGAGSGASPWTRGSTWHRTVSNRGTTGHRRGTRLSSRYRDGRVQFRPSTTWWIRR